MKKKSFFSFSNNYLIFIGTRKFTRGKFEFGRKSLRGLWKKGTFVQPETVERTQKWMAGWKSVAVPACRHGRLCYLHEADTRGGALDVDQDDVLLECNFLSLLNTLFTSHFVSFFRSFNSIVQLWTSWSPAYCENVEPSGGFLGWARTDVFFRLLRTRDHPADTGPNFHSPSPALPIEKSKINFYII